MEDQTEIVDLQLSDGTVIKIAATPIGDQYRSTPQISFRAVTSSIRSIAKDIAGTIHDFHQDNQLTKVSVKFGLEVALESGQLTALIAKGSSKANLEISMEWER